MNGDLLVRLLLILPLLVACRAPLALRAADCAQRPPRRAAPYDSSSWKKLVGSFTLVTVTTSPGLSGRVRRSALRLDTVPAAQRWYRREGMRGPHGPLQFRPLRGAELTWFRGEPWREGAEVEGTVLYTGCRECMDGSPDEYEIQFVSPWGFWGRWRNQQAGLVRAIDEKASKSADDPTGYFCALRR